MSSKVIIFNRLPAALIRVISEYTNVDALFLTCKELWNDDVRKEVVYLSLKDRDVAMRFYRDNAFRIYVFSRVQNPSRPISLYLRCCSGVTDVSALGKVHTLDLSQCSGVTDVSALGEVHTLDLSYCREVTDVSALGKVHTLDLRYCSGVTDVSALGKVHTLSLSYCSRVTDVSALGDVHALNISHCSGVTDVSALGNVHTVL